LSPSSILKLKADWQQEYETWKKRPLRGRYVYLYADGLYLKAGGDQDKTAVLVVLGVDEQGHKELLAIEQGYRESTTAWSEVLRSLKARGLVEAPLLAIGDARWGCGRHSTRWVGDARRNDSQLPLGVCLMCTNSFPIDGRGLYCTPRCRQRAYRLRHRQANRPTLIDLATRLRREQRLIDQTVYECSSCQPGAFPWRKTLRRMQSVVSKAGTRRPLLRLRRRPHSQRTTRFRPQFQRR
jgi:hypothetical protein